MRQPRAFFPIVDYERIIFAVSGPRTARHFAEIYKLPVGYVCFLHSKVIAHSRRNIEAGALVQIRLWAFIAEHVLPVISAERPSIFPLRINGSIAFANGDPSIFAGRNSGTLVRFIEPWNHSRRFRPMTSVRLVVVGKRTVEWILSWGEFYRNIIAATRGIWIVKAAIVLCPLFVP